MLPIYCPTEFAILLAGVEDERGVLRFPRTSPDTPGIVFAPKPLVPIQEQLMEQLSAAVGERVELKARIRQDFAEQAPLPNGKTGTVYLALLKPSSPPPKEWPTFPEILRALPPDRGRLPFVRAWQVFAGGFEQVVKAVDVLEVAKHLGIEIQPEE